MNPSRRAILPLPFAALAAQSPAQSPAQPHDPARAPKIVCVGAHPDDPESGCGGMLARYAAAGASVTIVYLTRGEAGIPTKSHDEAAAIRTAEAQAACRILGAKPVFAGQIDGATVVDKAAADSFIKLIAAEDPDVLLAHWPIDSHLDHQAASTLAFRAWRAGRGRFDLYYYEVELGTQTMGFHPTDYVDITEVREKKKAALLAHKSQGGDRVYRFYHEPMENQRGREAGCGAAEALVHLARVRSGSRLPG